MNLEGRKIAVFDAEIKKRIEDCSKGWQSHDEMGISVLVIFDYASMRYRIFDDKNAPEAIAILHSYDLVVGFNTVRFDWKLINATWGTVVGERKSRDYDILREIWLAKGLNPNIFKPETHGGYKLEDVAFDTIQMRKTSNGALAPIMFQEGRFAELVDYCLEDVRIERTLFEFIITHGFCVRGNQVIQMDLPMFAQEAFLHD